MVSVAYMRPESAVYGQPDGDFVAYHDIVVFDEHERDGVIVDRARLESIVDGCNYRIKDTGDFCTLVIGHTGENENSPDPEVVGFAGNYEVIDNFGALDPRSAISATWWIYREHDEADVMKKYPRRSVELWPEDNYFDPIALLGAETPCRDLGLAYEKGGKSIRYEMEGSVASGGNTFIPDLGNEKKKKKYAMEDILSPEVLAQVVQALEPVITEKLNDQLNIAPPPPPQAELEPERNELDTMDNEPEVEVDIDVDADGDDEDPAMDYDKEGDDVDDKKLDDEHPNTDSTDSIEGDPKDYKEKYHKYQFAKFAKMDGDDAIKCAMKYMGGLDHDDMGGVMSMLEDGSEDESTQEYYSKVKYSYSEAEEFAKDEGETDKVNAAKYRKKHLDSVDKYAKLEVQHKKVVAELADRDNQVRYAKRETALIELQSNGFAMDVSEEMEDCADFTDAQFTRHLDKIPSNYQKVPLGPGVARFSEVPNHDPNSEDAKHSETALAACKKYKKTDYGKVLKNVKANNGEYVEA